MLRLAAKNFWARKFRALATTFAVFIGIAFVSGTYVLTDSINNAFDEIFSDSLGQTDVVLSSDQPVVQDSAEVPPMPADVLGRVRQVDGVGSAVGAIFATGAFFTADGDRVGAPFAPQYISSSVPDRFESFTYEEGRAPESDDELALDAGAAGAAGLEVGDQMQVASEQPATSYEIVGITAVEGVSFGGTSVVIMTPDEAARISGRVGQYDWIYAVAEQGLEAGELKDRVADAVPGDILVETESEYAERQSSTIKDQLSFLRIALLVFAGIALFVGAFLIFNTFSITVAQRIREFGLLRTLGASRRQVLGSVVAEASIIGLVGAVAGLLGGLLVARGLTVLFEAAGADLPSAGLSLAPRTVAIGLALGLTVTLGSAFLPAIRSTRVHPMAAMQEGEIEGEQRSRVLPVVLSAIFAALGAGVLVYGLLDGSLGSGERAGLIGAGAVGLVVAVSIFSARLIAPFAMLIGAPLVRLAGMPGRLARDNSRRKPGRTAITAAALMVGIAVVTFFTIFSAGLKSTIDEAIGESFQGELVLSTNDFTLLSPRAAEIASEVDGVETVAALRYSQAEVDDAGRQAFTGLVPERAAELLSFDWVEGSAATLRDLTAEQVIVTEELASSASVQTGDSISVLTQTGDRPRYDVVGVISDQVGLFGSAIVTQDEIVGSFGAKEDMIDFVGLAAGADSSRVQDDIRDALDEAFPTVDVLNQAELREQQEQAVNQILFLVYALVLLAILVSLFGIANTLALSIHERIREVGMLRAIGMSKRQVRRMIRYEAVITAMIGAGSGMALGVLFAALISVPLSEEGFVLSFPVPTLVLILVLAALAGVLSAVLPARRASRIDMLAAVSHE